MKQMIKSLIIPFVMLTSFSASAAIIPLNATNTGTLATQTGWLDGDTSAIDFFVFEISADDQSASFDVSAASSMGMSLYAGELSDDPGFLFSNAGDFSNFAGDFLSYVAGTDPFTPGMGNNMLSITGLAAGIYTLALGGNEGFSFGDVDYVLSAQLPSSSVPEPGTAAMALVLLTALTVRRQTRRH